MLVTGGSRGIGAAIARTFAEEGDTVAVHYGRNREKAETVVAALPGDGHVVVGADLADPDATRAMVEEAAAALGAHRRAGQQRRHLRPAAPDHATPRTRSGSSRWSTTLAANLTGAANATWCAVRHMGRGGRIVMVASRGAFRGEPQPPGLRREQGGDDRARAVAGPRARARRDRGQRGRARLRGDRHDGRRAGRARGRRAAGRQPVREGRRSRRRSRPPCATSPRPRRRWPAAACIDVNGASFLRM